MLGIIYRFTRIDVHLQSQGYLPHFPRVQQHPPSSVLKKTNKELNLSCYICTEVALAVKSWSRTQQQTFLILFFNMTYYPPFLLPLLH